MHAHGLLVPAWDLHDGVAVETQQHGLRGGCVCCCAPPCVPAASQERLFGDMRVHVAGAAAGSLSIEPPPLAAAAATTANATFTATLTHHMQIQLQLLLPDDGSSGVSGRSIGGAGSGSAAERGTQTAPSLGCTLSYLIQQGCVLGGGHGCAQQPAATSVEAADDSSVQDGLPDQGQHAQRGQGVGRRSSAGVPAGGSNQCRLLC